MSNEEFLRLQDDGNPLADRELSPAKIIEGEKPGPNNPLIAALTADRESLHTELDKALDKAIAHAKGERATGVDFFLIVNADDVIGIRGSFATTKPLYQAIESIERERPSSVPMPTLDDLMAILLGDEGQGRLVS